MKMILLFSLFVFVSDEWSHYVTHPGLELLESSNLSTSASQVAGGGGAAVFISCHFVSFSIPVCSYRSFSAVLFCSHLYVSFLPEALLFNEFSVHFVVWLSSAFLV